MYATAQFFAGTKDGKPAFLDYATGESNLLPAVKQKIYLNDIRTLAIQPTLQSHGFQRADFPSCTPESAFLPPTQADPSPSNAIPTYYHECESLIRSLTGATTVHAFHHRHRQQQPPPTDTAEKIKTYTTTPVPDMHIDNDAATAHAHLARQLPPAEAARWTAPNRRWAIVNVWRPLAPIHQMPLALLDPSSTPIHMTGLAEPNTVGLEPTFPSSPSPSPTLEPPCPPKHRINVVSNKDAGDRSLLDRGSLPTVRPSGFWSEGVMPLDHAFLID
ncbi:hypothetical protein P171DRAFT_521057 [Karstenula rhodostoma CBS 690.94]|uniref:Uncharacterized protein n=1 Tax=Karstenula rhodostoma CBS 690.94 TaxID=1392251 RepID=A0A9P4PH54_9PLEO|nr:hypothetical protein P171DRAFT_521057 [Karstenula rhodostoma CBS 690.94]